jgi:hypothetical protein
MGVMEKAPKPDNGDERDDAVMAADDTGLLASQHLVVEEEILEHTEPPEEERDRKGA